MLHSEWDTVFLKCSWDSKEGEILFISILTSSPHLREGNVEDPDSSFFLMGPKLS